jgi:hypothetical protein
MTGAGRERSGALFLCNASVDIDYVILRAAALTAACSYAIGSGPCRRQ